jgi:hypothetical protein
LAGKPSEQDVKRSGPSTTIRKKPCRRLPSGLGLKMQDGRKTTKLANDIHKMNKILARKKGEKDGGHYDDDDLPSSRLVSPVDTLGRRTFYEELQCHV